MTPGEHSARDALRGSVKENHQQVAMTDESRVLLADLLEQRMATSVAEGIQAVMTNELFWARVFEVLQKQAAERTGRFLWGSFKEVLKKVAWFALVGVILWSIGGWSLVKLAWNATGGKP